MYRLLLICSVSALVAACDEEPVEGPDDRLDLGDDDDDAPPTETVTEPEPECGSTELCQKTIQDCGVAMDQAQCESWYLTESNCADMAAYTECNCDCAAEDVCDDYFECGEACFARHC